MPRLGTFSIFSFTDTLLLRIDTPLWQRTEPLVCGHSRNHNGHLHAARRLGLRSNGTPLWPRNRQKNCSHGWNGHERSVAWTRADNRITSGHGLLVFPFARVRRSSGRTVLAYGS